jgi:hypothetical protein
MSDYDLDTLSGQRSWMPRPPREVLEPLPDLNTYCLDTLVEQAQTGTAHPAALRIAERWLALDAAARKRLASHPYLLFDAGFADPRHWLGLESARIHDTAPAEYAQLAATPRQITGAQYVLCYAWSIAGHHADHAPLALGMHPQCAEQIAKRTILQMLLLAPRTAGWLRPRWLNAPEVWEDLAHGAAEGGIAHARAGLQGMRLVATELATLVYPGYPRGAG